MEIGSEISQRKSQQARKYIRQKTRKASGNIHICEKAFIFRTEYTAALKTPRIAMILMTIPPLFVLYIYPRNQRQTEKVCL